MVSNNYWVGLLLIIQQQTKELKTSQKERKLNLELKSRQILSLNI